MSLVDEAHARVAGAIGPGARVVDATVGNGHDTLRLALRVGPSGLVVGYDVQEEALCATRRRLEAGGMAGRVELRHESHTALAALEDLPVFDAVMFNLGYLPGSHRDVRTSAAGTRVALDAALRRVRSGGRISVVAYPGHEGGIEECRAVSAWATEAAERGHRVEELGIDGARKPAPRLFVVEVRRGAERMPFSIE